MNMQDFYTGHAFDAYEFFGAHTYFGGTHFAVWAPSAQHIAVETEIGTFDLHRTQSAVWECDAPGVNAGMVYQYWVRGANGQSVAHCDPYGTAMTLRPDGRSIVSDRPQGFDDDQWMQARTKCFDKPLNIYEAHAGSWRQKEDGSWYTYAELAELLPAYCKENGFTHIELMPLAEHPFDGSWGYQITGFFAPTSRYGTPDELAEFVNACHKQGIGVILDFVPVHFAVDAYGLKEFDGTPLYEYPAAAVGQSEWGSCNFMHSRGEIQCFIQSCADYWLRVFHADGLRMDAVSRLIYWQGDPNRGVNGSTLDFLKGMNCGLQQRHPTAILIAEDSTSFPKVTAPVEYGGLGFDYKWDLGWMNDTLDYFKKTPDERRENLGKLTFSMMYAWNEHYILPFSHDENVHGHRLHPALHHGGGQPPAYRVLACAQHPRCSQGSQGVLHAERPGHPHGVPHTVHREGRTQPTALPCQSKIAIGPHIGPGDRAVGYDAAGNAVHDFPHPGVVDVENSRAALLKQRSFPVQILGKIRVLAGADVVGRQVREHAHIKLYPRRAVKLHPQA